MNSNSRPNLTYLIVLLTSCVLAGLGCAIGAGDDRRPVDTALPSITPTSGEATQISPERSTEDLARSTVQVIALLRDAGDLIPLWSGSGSIISNDGLILTNSHVVDTSLFSYDALGVALTDRSDSPPKLSYLAEVVAEDSVLDLAVLRIVSDIDGVAVITDLPFIGIGDSDSITIGDRLRILGYPGIGGETITFTEGAVSGFTLERGIAGRAWIKTDATIAGGNSGGLGANSAGELIGVPTIVTSGSERGQPVDCRPLVDTDRDGDVDEQDNCVPVGGFINALRPVKLALPLIEAARRGGQYSSVDPSGEQSQADGPTGVLSFSNLVFSDGVTEDNQPTQLWYALPASSTQVCAFWDYLAMRDGAAWSTFWFVNGDLDETSSVLDQKWGGGTSGNWWVCIFNSDGLPAGLYELVLEVEGNVLISDAVFVGGDRIAASLLLANNSSQEVCELYLSPQGARNWGQNEVEAGETIAPRSEREFQAASGAYDVRISSCAGEVMYEELALELKGELQIGLED